MTSAISSSTSTQQPWQVHKHDDSDRKARMDKSLSGVADLLDMSTDDIETAQKNGTTLADLAKQKGVSESDLESALAKGLKENAPADAPSDVDFTQMASDIANGKGPGGHHGHGPKPPESDGSNSATALQSLLQNNGIDSSELSSLLSSSSTDSSTTSSDSSDFAAQLKNLISQYGSKGLSYDTKL